MSRLSERIENFNRAYKLFSLAQIAYTSDRENDINKLAIIQAFEIVYELGWKVIKDILDTKGIKVYTPKDVIKTAFSTNILPTAQVWIDMSDDRNSSSHEYDNDKTDKIIEKIAGLYYEELTRFKNSLGEYNAW